jgi:sulfotransferase famil protein
MARGPQRLIVSLHIPKTGGTSFGAVMEQAWPGGVAYFYRPGNRLTHPMLRDRDRLGDPELLAELEETGVKVIHGHAPASRFREAIPDPARYWTWVRDPVERVISAYYYLDSRAKRLAARDGEPSRDRIRGRTLEQFARRPAHRNMQSRALADFDMAELGFVGVTERFDESLAILGLPALTKVAAKNVNKTRPEIDPKVRHMIWRFNEEDRRLYDRALELHEKRKAALG